MTDLYREFKERVLAEGIESVRPCGLRVRVLQVDGIRHETVVTVEIVDQDETPLIEITRQTLRPGDAVTVFQLDEAFKVIVT